MMDGQRYEFAETGQVGPGQWIRSPQWFVFALQDDRRYIVEVDAEKAQRETLA